MPLPAVLPNLLPCICPNDLQPITPGQSTCTLARKDSCASIAHRKSPMSRCEPGRHTHSDLRERHDLRKCGRSTPAIGCGSTQFSAVRRTAVLPICSRPVNRSGHPETRRTHARERKVFKSNGIVRSTAASRCPPAPLPDRTSAQRTWLPVRFPSLFSMWARRDPRGGDPYQLPTHAYEATGCTRRRC